LASIFESEAGGANHLLIDHFIEDAAKLVKAKTLDRKNCKKL
jgi:hypothetical protein